MISPLSHAFCLVVMTLAVTGCAHQRATEQANRHMEQGRYELAINALHQASTLKPDDKATQMSLEYANQRLDSWLDHLQQDAQESIEVYPGRALLLYGKLAQQRADPATLRQYQLLRNDISVRHQPSVTLDYNSDVFGDYLGQSIPGLNISATSDTELQFRLENIHSKITQQESIQQQQYFDGYEVIANPAFSHLQDSIRRQRDREHELRHDFRRNKKRQHRLGEQIKEQQFQVTELQQQQTQFETGTAQYNRLQTQLTAARSQLDEKRKRQQRLRRKADKIDRRRHKSSKRLWSLYDNLSSMPATVEQEVYRDYSYPVTLLTRKMSADIVIDNNGQTRVKTITVTDTDDEYDAHPIIGLESKLALLKSEDELRDKLYTEATAGAENHLQALVERHRSTLLSKAEQTRDPNKKIELLVAYSLSGNQSVNEGVENKIRQLLQNKFGLTGEFPIRELLN